jgi:Transposase
MERDGSGVSALLGLDGFVVSARCSTRRAASGGSRWRPPRIGPGASPAACERSAMAQPYATAVAAGLPDARLVVDHFHVIRLANAALDEVRRRVQQTTTGHRGRNDDPLFQIRRRLPASHDRLR